MYPIILPLVMATWYGRLSSLTLLLQVIYEKETSEFKRVKQRLKTDLVSDPTRVERLGKYIFPFENFIEFADLEEGKSTMK